MDINISGLILEIIVYSLGALMLLVGIDFIFQPKWPFIKRYVGCFYGKKGRFLPYMLMINDYTLVGVWGFTEHDIKVKIKLLKLLGIRYSGYAVPLHQVERFSQYCERF